MFLEDSISEERLAVEDLQSRLSLSEAKIQVAKGKAKWIAKKAILHFAKIT